jgi:hypothetical protein
LDPKTIQCFCFQDNYAINAYPCHEAVAASQFFSFSKNYQLRREDSCAEIGQLAGAGYEPIKMVTCSMSEDQQWIHTKQVPILLNSILARKIFGQIFILEFFTKLRPTIKYNQL